MRRGPRNNNSSVWDADPSRLAALRILGIAWLCRQIRALPGGRGICNSDAPIRTSYSCADPKRWSGARWRWVGLLAAVGIAAGCAASQDRQADGGQPTPDQVARSETAAPDVPVAGDVPTPEDTPASADVPPDKWSAPPEDIAGSGCERPACIEVAAFPFTSVGNTADSATDRFDTYACAPGSGAEQGPEQVYRLQLDTPGTLVAMLDDGSDVGADVDVHLLDALDPARCLARGHLGLSRHLAPGTYYLVADSWSDADGQAYPGPYTLYAHFLPDDGPCGLLGQEIPRIGTDERLSMPATGPVVLEAHLVTDAERTDGSWPGAPRDGIDAHYALSEAATGYAMTRGEDWAPCCEPSNDFGQGSSARPPVEAEAWYINMRWADRPPRGERYLVFDGRTGRAVVAAAGYENGPGDLTRVGGACEEIHHYFSTRHLSTLTFGVALRQELPYGPIDCHAR